MTHTWGIWGQPRFRFRFRFRLRLRLPVPGAASSGLLCLLLQLLAITITTSTTVSPVSAHEILQSPTLYDWGFYGLYPQTWFKSFHLAAPRLNFIKWDESCDDGVYLVSPRGSHVYTPGPVIMDGRGNLVWTTADRFGNGQGVTDFKVQTYNGTEYLTFWSGMDGAHHRFGYGCYYMLDETYQIVKTIDAIETSDHSLRGDLHEFHITKDDTALMSVYYPQPADLSPVGGPRDGWVLDSIFQEINIETGELIFEWRASDHVPIDKTMRSFVGSDLGDSPNTGFDYFHINSVDKDGDGNYLVSGRHTHTVVCISPEGDTLWTLGGKENMFKDLSNGHATDFTWQHHARWHANNTISIFDNAKSTNGGRKYIGDHSRGMLIQIDTEAMTARLLHDYSDPQHYKLSESQGSMQVMEDSGKVLVDYGFLPTFTEFAPTGEVLCDVRFGPWLVWQTGMVTTYRTFKSTKWVGRPWYAPNVYLRPSDDVLYVSWNGATEVVRWVLQGADWEGVGKEAYLDLDAQAKDGFEGAFDLQDGMPRYLRVAALDGNGHVLKHSEVIDRVVGNAPASSLHGVMMAVGVALGILLVAMLLRKRICSTFRTRCPRGLSCLVQVKRRWKDWREGGRKRYEELQMYED